MYLQRDIRDLAQVADEMQFFGFMARNNSKPVEDILPITIWWLDKKLDENGKLNKNESKIIYQIF